MDRNILNAPEGKRYKKNDVYGIQIILGVDDNPNDWELVDETDIDGDEDESI